MILASAQRIGQAVIADIYQQVQVGTADRFVNDTFGLS